jgi:hypothetical protein
VKPANSVKSVRVDPAVDQIVKKRDEWKEYQGYQGVSEKVVHLVKNGKELQRETSIVTMAMNEWEQEWGEVMGTVERWLDA